MRPFAFQRLTRMPRREARLRTRFARSLGVGAGDAVGAALAPLLGGPLRVSLVHVESLDVPGEWPPKDGPYCAVVFARPDRRRALCEIDPAFALSLADRALGGSGETALARPLAATERGVIVYLALRALGAIGAASAWSVRSVLTAPHAAGLVLGADVAVGASFSIAISGGIGGIARLILPEPLAGQLAEDADTSPPAPDALHRIGSIAAPLHVIVGRSEIGSADLAALAVGDAILLDEATVRIDGRVVAGVVGLRLPLGRHARWMGTIVESGSAVRIDKVDSRKEIPMDKTKVGRTQSKVTDLAGAAPSTGEAGTAALREVPVEIVCEMGRISMTARDVLSLRVGEVLEFARAPGEPVDLRAGDRLLARGDLIEVEGRLGVRVTEIVPV